MKEKILDVIGGPHVAAIATIAGGLPALRFMELNGFPDMTIVGDIIKNSRKVEQLKKNPQAAIAIWSGKEFSDPYVVIKAEGEIHEDLATKKKYWNPMYEQYFNLVDNADYVILKFIANEIEYTEPRMMGMEIWRDNHPFFSNGDLLGQVLPRQREFHCICSGRLLF